MSDIEVELTESRYSRLKLIPWWDQERLLRSRVMVVGAGALGNEIIKNLALLGIGNILIVDFDRVENSNLTRSVLFREEDEGRPKAQVAALRAHELNPDVRAKALAADITSQVGLGTFRAMDLVITGLDSREARVAVNECCWKVARPWIDGAIETLYGVARVFVPPDGPCYECTMNDLDRRILAMRQSCALISREDLLEGKIPTTPTTASVIAGIETQEAMKLLHGREDLPILAGHGFFFNGLSHDSFTVEYQRREDCPSHHTFQMVEELDVTSDISLGELLEIGRSMLGAHAIIEFEREIVVSLRCAECKTEEPVFRAIGAVTTQVARCPRCGSIRTPEFTHSFSEKGDHLDMSVREVGLPPYDIVTARLGQEMRHLEISGDREKVLWGFA